jgi:hypothetical protein
MQLPAVCESCGRPFPSGFEMTGPGNSLAGLRSKPCLWCHVGVGVIPDGVYDIYENAMHLIERLPTTRDDLVRAAGIFNDAITEGNADVGKIVERVATEAPTASPIMALLDSPRVAAVLAILAIIETAILTFVH